MQATAFIHEHFQLPSPLPELRQFDAAELSKQLEQCRQPVHHVLVFSPAEWGAKPAEAPSVSPKLDALTHLNAIQENETLKKQIAEHRAEQDRLANLVIARNEVQVALEKQVEDLQTKVRNLESQNKLYSDTLRFEALWDKIKGSPYYCHELGRNGDIRIWAIPQFGHFPPEFMVSNTIRAGLGIPTVSGWTTNKRRVYNHNQDASSLLEELKAAQQRLAPTAPAAAKTQ